MTNNEVNAPSDTVLANLLANHRRFLAFLESRVGNRDDAEEILQAAFARTVQKADDIRESENAVAWFYRLLRNAVIDHYRRKAASERLLENYTARLPDGEEAANADLEHVVCECVNDLIQNLKPDYATLIREIDLNSSDIASVAAALGITEGNTRVRLHRARAALRHELERTCRTCATHGCLDCTCSAKECGHAPKN